MTLIWWIVWWLNGFDSLDFAGTNNWVIFLLLCIALDISSTAVRSGS